MKKELENLRREIASFLQIKVDTRPVSYKTLEEKKEESYRRYLIEYEGSESDLIRAYLFVPEGKALKPGVLVHHQHNGERHLGKSEVAGLAGDPFQAFGPELAKRGMIVLAPDSINFEDRRKNKQGLKPAADPDEDFLQHYNEMCYRLLSGDLLMRKVLADSFLAVDLLAGRPLVDRDRIGILGHSYGGNTVLFHSPFDERIHFACSSGALCSYEQKIKSGTGIEMAEVIPGFTKVYDIDDLLKCTAPRKMLIVAGTEDKYAQDAGEIVEKARSAYREMGGEGALFLKEYPGGHALDEERFNYIVNWLQREA